MFGAYSRKSDGGYKPTTRNLEYLRKWKRGESIGFTMTASLKAKGLIPRTSKTMHGRKILGPKYSTKPRRNKTRRQRTVRSSTSVQS